MQTEKITAYELVKKEELTDIHSTGYLWKHKKSGARVCFLLNEDENKVFHITFRTPPSDSTGVPHILEHSVLCGSKEFPSKDPFVELVKGSLNTFLNAMTYPDKTMYPVASCNDADFKNLMHVYLDAVFFTNIYEKEEIFRQEGWSYQLEEPDGELTYNGVVYNEMKGAFSSPEDVLDREILNSLYPDTPYGWESGGDPACIPNLKYSEFLGFHSRYYHPSNSYLYFYGNLDMEERLTWLDEKYLSQYDALKIQSEIPLQPAFSKPREVYKKYSISNTDSLKDNSYLSFNASISTSLDVRLALAFAVIEYALLSAPGAPLKQALLDAGVGKDILGSYDSGIYQPMFSVIAKYSNREQKEQFLEIIRQVLGQIVKEGLDQKAILAGINFMEFRYREADYGTYPKGLMYGIEMMDSWLHDDERPFDYLCQLSVFAYLKEQVGTGYYEELIKTWLLDNSHVSVVIIEPEKGLAARMEEEVRNQLAEYKKSLSDAEIQELVDKTKKLRRFQETPSTKEELEAIPMLSREDISRKTQPLIVRESELEGVPFLRHELFTNGIGYLKLLFEVDYLEKEEIPYLGILKAVLGMVDTQHYGYGELFNEINMQSGGIVTSLGVYPDYKEPGKYRAFFELHTKALYEKMGFVCSMLEEILFRSKLEDEKRLYEIIAQLKSRLQMRLSSSGHSTAAVRSMAYFSEISAFNDMTGGIAFYKLVEKIEGNFEKEKEGLVRKLRTVMEKLFCKNLLTISYTADQEGMEALLPSIRPLIGKLMEKKQPRPSYTLAYGPLNEGFQTSAKVQYVARSGNYRRKGLEYTGALRILKVILGYEYLWTNVRVKGGAYGCMNGFGVTGDSYFVSYRDPNLKKTLEVYEGVAEYVEHFTVSDRDMTKYIIGAISELDVPLSAKGKGARSLSAYLSHITEADFQRERDQVLDADQESIRRLSELVSAVLSQESLCVIGGEERLLQDKELFGQLKPLIG